MNSLMQCFRRLNVRAAYPVIGLIRMYQFFLSPTHSIIGSLFFPKICMHEPDCSSYGVQVLKRYGLFPGIGYMGDRILRCRGGEYSKYQPSALRVAFASSSAIGISFLKQINDDQRFDLVGVLTLPAMPRGRGKKIQDNIIALSAKSIDDSLPIVAPKTLSQNTEEGKKAYNILKNRNIDYLLVLSYGKIVPQSILDIPKIGPINIHGSILPNYRGPSPLQSVFLDNQSETGLTAMYMDKNMDTGDIIDVLPISLGLQDTVEDLLYNIEKKGPRRIANVLRDFSTGDLHRTVQDHDKASYTKKFTKEDGRIDPRTMSLKEIYMKYRAYKLGPKIWFFGSAVGSNESIRFIVEIIHIDEKLYFTSSEQQFVDEENNLHPAVTVCKVKEAGKKTVDRNLRFRK